MPNSPLPIFGGEKPWSPVDWTDSDDRVRGGKSQSYISANAFEPVARFYGNLDIETLGGAGFASQRTATDTKRWDLSKYEGIKLEIEEGSDSKKYTLILKDTILETSADSTREQASISYEHDFTISDSTSTTTITTFPPSNNDPSKSPSEKTPATVTKLHTLYVPFAAFEPTYRGRAYKSAPDLRTGNVRRFSIMNRSFFGSQSGPFALRIRSISAYGEAGAAGWRESKVLPPLLLVVGSAVLMRVTLWGIDTFLR